MPKQSSTQKKIIKKVMHPYTNDTLKSGKKSRRLTYKTEINQQE